MSSQSRALWNKQFFEGALSAAAAQFWRLYKNEFFALFSPDTLAWLLDRGERRLTLRVGRSEEKALRFSGGDAEEGNSPISPAELRQSSLAEALARRGAAREAAKLLVEMPRDCFFVRRFDIPAAAEASLPKLLVADIERKTPFRPGDVVYDCVLTRRSDAPEKLAVELWILRRDILERAIEGSGVLWDDIDFVTAYGPQGLEGPAIPLGRIVQSSHWFRNAAIGLAALTLALIATGLAAEIWRQDKAAEELDEKIGEISSRASNVRKIADQAVAESRLLQILIEERAKTPTFAELWEEVSKILPDGAYLSELRLSETKSGERSLDLVGFAESAVGLPLLFDKSPILSDALLTAPITPVPIEKREAFSLRVKVKPSSAEQPK